MDKLFEIEDNSGDRKYFTMVPNYVLNHSSGNAQSLYLQLKRLAGENGLAYPGARYLMKQIGISYNTLKKEFRYLLEKGWITYEGEKNVQTEGGMQKLKAYRIIDLWKLNVDYYERGVKIETPLSRRGVKIGIKGVSKSKRKKNSREEELRESATPVIPFSLKEEIGKLKGSPQRHIQLIGEYLEEVGFSCESKSALDATLKRHLRDAVILSKFTDSQIGKASDYADKEYKKIGWNLGTLVKIITSNLYEKR